MNEALFISYIDNFEIYDKYLHMGWEEILDTSIYDREDHCMKYELIDPLKNLRFTLVLETKELSLVIMGITKLCLLYLFECVKVLSFI